MFIQPADSIAYGSIAFHKTAIGVAYEHAAFRINAVRLIIEVRPYRHIFNGSAIPLGKLDILLALAYDYEFSIIADKLHESFPFMA